MIVVRVATLINSIFVHRVRCLTISQCAVLTRGSVLIRTVLLQTLQVGIDGFVKDNIIGRIGESIEGISLYLV